MDHLTSTTQPVTLQPRSKPQKRYSQTRITVREASQITGLAESTIRGRKAGTHKLTRIKHGRAVRLVRQEVEALDADRKRIAQREAGTLK